VPDVISPRGTFLNVANAVQRQIESDAQMTELPSIAELMEAHSVSRGVVLRAFAALQKDGLAEPVPGSRWRVIRSKDSRDRRPLAERLLDVFEDDALTVGAAFPSTSVLSSRFSVSRPTISKALDKLEAGGWLSAGGQGKVRTVRAVPSREEPS
jgi:DNA-binding GntR family transcriptional regulator